MNKTKLFLILLTTSMLFGLQSNAAVMADSGLAGTQTGITYPSYYPASFDRKGVVSKVKAGAHQVVIDGRQYSYQVDLQVHSSTQKYGSGFNLKVGQTLGFSYTEDSKGNRILTEVWVIDPSDYQGT